MKLPFAFQQSRASSRNSEDFNGYGRLSRVEPADVAEFVASSTKPIRSPIIRNPAIMGWISLLAFALCSGMAFLVWALIFDSPWWWTCDPAPGLELCNDHLAGIEESHFSLFGCNGWYDPHMPGRQCRNRCGLQVNQHTAQNRAAPAFNGTRLFLSNSSACTIISIADEFAITQAEECVAFCAGALGKAFWSPSCWTSFDVPYVCLRSRIASWARKAPYWSYKAGAIAYTLFSVFWASRYEFEEKAPQWRWAEKAPDKLPWKLLEWCSSEISEETAAKSDLRGSALFMLIERWADINALSKYLHDGDICYIFLTVVTLFISADPLQTHALVEYRKSVARGFVGTRELAVAKANEGVFEGAWAVLTPAAAILSAHNMCWFDLTSLLVALALSLHTIFGFVGGALEVAGSMATRTNMPFSAQCRIERKDIKILRVGELCSLIPVVVCILEWGIRPLYIFGFLILSITYVSIFLDSLWRPKVGLQPWCFPVVFVFSESPFMNMKGHLVSMSALPKDQACTAFPFQVMNPKAFGLPSVFLASLLWPLTPLWLGSFCDPAGECAGRHQIAQAFLPTMPPTAYYTGRILLSICCWSLLLAPYLGLTSFLQAGTLLHATQLHCALGAAQSMILFIGVIAPFLVIAVFYRTPCLWKVWDSDAAILERGQCMIRIAKCCQHHDSLHFGTKYTVLGCAHLRLRNIKQAQEYLENAFRILEGIPDADDLQLALVRMYLSRAYHMDAKPDSPNRGHYSLEYALSVIEKHDGPQSIDGARALEGLGNSHRLSEKPQEAMSCYTKALEMREALGREFIYGAEVAFLKVSIGRTLLRQEDYDKAIDQTTQAALWLGELYGEESEHVGWALRAVGTAYLKDHQAEKCIKESERALPLLEAGFGPDHPEVANVLRNIGQAYSELGIRNKNPDFCDKGIKYYEGAKQISSLTSKLRTDVQHQLQSARQASKQLSENGGEEILHDPVDVKQGGIAPC